MKQNILILQCLCIIRLNTVKFILILQEVYGNLKEGHIEGHVDLVVDNNHIPNNLP